MDHVYLNTLPTWTVGSRGVVYDPGAKAFLGMEAESTAGIKR